MKLLLEYFLNHYILENSNSYNYVLSLKQDFSNTVINDNITENDYIKILNDIGFTGDEFNNIAKIAYNIWKNDFNLAKNNIPFRFPSDIYKGTNEKYIKLARCYKDLNVLSQDKILNSLKIKDENGTVINIIIGNGLGKGQNGYKFEDEILSGLCTYMVNGCTLENLNYSGDVYKVLENVNNSNLKNYLLAVYQEFTKNSSIDIKNINGDKLIKLFKSFLFKPGESNNKRNIDNIIPIKNEDNYDLSSIENLRKDSGKIISDITLKLGDIKNDLNLNDNFVYISLKKSKAQLSGVIVSPSKRGIFTEDSKWMDQVLFANTNSTKQYNTLDELKIDKELAVKAFINFWETLQVNPNSLYEKFINNINEEQEIELIKNLNDDKNIGLIIQNLIGGNYWYLSPEHCLYIPYQNKEWTFKANKCYLTKSKRTIFIEGKLNKNIDIKLTVRDSSGGNYAPNRLFPIVEDISKLYENIGIDK